MGWKSGSYPFHKYNTPCGKCSITKSVQRLKFLGYGIKEGGYENFGLEIHPRLFVKNRETCSDKSLLRIQKSEIVWRPFHGKIALVAVFHKYNFEKNFYLKEEFPHFGSLLNSKYRNMKCWLLPSVSEVRIFLNVSTIVN